MQRLEILTLVLDHQNFFQNSPDIIQRNIPVSQWLDGHEINFIYGPPHTGKTSLLKQAADIVQGMKVYVDFEDSRFNELKPEDFSKIKEIAIEGYRTGHEDKELENEEKHDEKNTGSVYYFLDNIQNVSGWEDWIDSLQREGAHIFITSSTLPMNQETSSRFANRIKIHRLLPFSFKEYLTLKGLRVPRPNFLTPSRCDDMLCLFLRYFENGGFPEIIKTEDYRLSRKYFEEILQEIIARYNIRDPQGIKKLAVFLISNMASEYSVDTLRKMSGIDSEDTIRDYLDYLEGASLISRTRMFNYTSEKPENEKENEKENRTEEGIEKGIENKKANKEDIPCKVYAADTSFFKSVFPNYPDSLGLRFENLVFLELLRQGKEVSYFRDGRECNFLITEDDNCSVTAAVQVSICFGSPAIKEREIIGLVAAMEKYGLNDGLILTMDDEGVMEIANEDGEEKKITIKQVWKWMLE